MDVSTHSDAAVALFDAVARGEVADGELDKFIARRDAQRRQDEGERLEEVSYAESVRAYHRRRRRELVAERYAHEMRMGDLHDGLAREHYANAEKLCEGTKGDAA